LITYFTNTLFLSLSVEATAILLFYTGFFAVQIINSLNYSPKLFATYYSNNQEDKRNYENSAVSAVSQFSHFWQVSQYILFYPKLSFLA